MKKVGIITVHRLPNWGSVLQAYALQRVIHELGYDVENIDYRFPNEFHWARGKNWGKRQPLTLKNIIKRLINEIQYALHLKSRPMMDLLNDFIKKNMKLSSEFSNYDKLHEKPPQYDVYISGSDQIWNPNTLNTKIKRKKQK